MNKTKKYWVYEEILHELTDHREDFRVQMEIHNMV